MIYTSRYANKELSKEEYYAVAISLGLPKFPLKYKIRERSYEIAPKGNMLKMEKGPYRDAYMRKLRDSGRDSIVNLVRRMEGTAAEEDKSLVLLCFEDVSKPEQWCHRTMFAEWWEEMTGEKIEEMEKPVIIPPKPTMPVDDFDYEQFSMF